MESHKMLQIILTLPYNLIIIFWPRIMDLSVTLHLPSNFSNTGISQRTIMLINRWFYWCLPAVTQTSRTMHNSIKLLLFNGLWGQNMHMIHFWLSDMKYISYLSLYGRKVTKCDKSSVHCQLTLLVIFWPWVRVLSVTIHPPSKFYN